MNVVKERGYPGALERIAMELAEIKGVLAMLPGAE